MMKVTFVRILVSCLCCFALTPLLGAEEEAWKAAVDEQLEFEGERALIAFLWYRDNDEQNDPVPIAVLEYLIANGAEVNAKAEHSPSVLHAAVWCGDVKAVEFLIAKGADLHAKNPEGETPLFWAESLELINLLVDKGADVHAKDNDGNTLLHHVEHVEVAKHLVSLGLDAHAKDNNGATPLHGAESVEVAEYFISLGLDVHAKGK